MSKLKSVYIDRSGDWARSGNDTGKFYLKDEVDAILSENDREIIKLKAEIENYIVVKNNAEQVLRDLLSCGLIKEWFYNGTYHAVLEADDPHLQIAELNAKLDEKDKEIAYWIKEYDEETKLTEALKAEIETLKASHYAEMVDAGMRERRLRRALYKVCAKWAFLAQWEKGELVENWEKWEKVERKCGAKAKEYK